jgi:RND family efflux transporter MFP subunit
MNVVSPAAGTVMDRLVAPGAKVRQAMDGLTSAHIVHLYDPQRLQVRVDVPLADAARIHRGQKARIVADVLPDTEFTGQVTRFVHLADISKNTVQVKVAIDAPTVHVKPDMLARVKFLTRPEAADGSDGGRETAGLRVFVPPEALVGDASAAWVVSTSGQRVRRQPVVVGPGRRMGWVEIAEGLNAGDIVVAAPPEGLTDGQRVRIFAQEDRL